MMLLVSALMETSAVAQVGLALSVAGTCVAALYAWYVDSRHKKVEAADQREVDAIHAEIAHTAKVAGVDEASRVVNLVFSEQIDKMTAEQRAKTQMLSGDPVAMASYVQAIIDQGTRPDA